MMDRFSAPPGLAKFHSLVFFIAMEIDDEIKGNAYRLVMKREKVFIGVGFVKNLMLQSALNKLTNRYSRIGIRSVLSLGMRLHTY